MDDLAINISSSKPSKTKKPQQTQANSIKYKEDVSFSRKRKIIPESDDYSVADDLPVPPRKKHPIGGSTDQQKKSKFSSLFRNNPEIPHLEDLKVAPLREDVFSSEYFSELNLHPHLVSCLDQRMKVTKMTAVQRQCIPHVLKGSDVLVKSQTGSGKTLCYAVPIVQQLQAVTPLIQRQDGPYAIVILPTRELALQSFECIETLLKSFVRLVPGCIMGGEKKSSEKARLRKGVNILLSTPGRLLDHLQHTKSLRVDRVQYLVLDEADRMLDLGYEKEVSEVVSILKERARGPQQTLLLSATLSDKVQKLAGISLNAPIKVDITEGSAPGLDGPALIGGSDKEHFVTPEGLKHHYTVVPSKLRLVSLLAFLLWKAKQDVLRETGTVIKELQTCVEIPDEKYWVCDISLEFFTTDIYILASVEKYSKRHKKVIVFLATQDSVDFHAKVLSHILLNPDDENDLDFYSLHGNMPQDQRMSVFRKFAKATSGILLCTDVAARGLNISNVRWIVQYNTPGRATDYIHRVGRTARIGDQGHALLFLSPAEVDYLKVLQQYQISLQELKMEDILKALMFNPSKWATAERLPPNTPQECATAAQVAIETYIQSSKDLRTMARKAYQSSVRAYAAYPASMKTIFHVKKLHLGHMAKSFGLQDAPTHISRVVSRTAGAASKRDHSHSRGEPQVRKKPRLDLISEFASGLDGSIHQEEKRKKMQKKAKTLQKRAQAFQGFRKPLQQIRKTKAKAYGDNRR